MIIKFLIIIMNYKSSMSNSESLLGRSTKKNSFFTLGLIICALMMFNEGQAQYQSVNRTMRLSQNYSVDYFTHNLNGVLSVRFFLKLADVDISNWTTQGQKGIWLGIGFG
jgi:hypothetical protein